MAISTATHRLRNKTPIENGRNKGLKVFASHPLSVLFENKLVLGGELYVSSPLKAIQ